MKVLLISPPFTVYAGIKGHGGLSAPLNLGYLASYVLSRSDGFDVSILDAEAEELTYERVVDRVKESGARVVGITSTTPSFDVVTELCGRIKASLPGVDVVLGGPHVTALPRETLELGSARFVVMGEGERTFLELLQVLDTGKGFASIDGLAFRDDRGQINLNGPRALIQDLDELPPPARDRMPMHLYHSPPTKSLGMGKVVTMLTSRGCPYRCNYCISSVMWGKGSVRYRSAGSVLKEMAECMERYDAREFNFHDDLFVNRKQRLIDICRGMMELESPVGWICMARADAIDEETIRWMKRAGCQKIAFGIESGSQTILKSMNKKLDISKARGAFELCRKYDIKTGASFMIGYLNETEGTIRETIEFMKELDADTVSVFQASPYPGTGFYQEAAARGFIRTDFKWEDFALVTHSKSVVDLPGLSSDRIRYWIRRAYAEYYLRPSYIVRQLSRVRSYHDLENILRGAGIFSNIMGKAKLMRRLSRR